MSFIGVDLGTSFIKGAVLDLEAFRLRHVCREPFPAFLTGLPPGYREVDPLEVVQSVRRLVEHLLQYATDCGGVIFCGQMHGFVLCNNQGKPVTNFISWQDQRALLSHPRESGSFFDVISRRISEAEQRRMGNALRPGLAICTLFSCAESGKLPDGRFLPVSLADFVAANLCGTLPRTDLTNAAALGALNFETLSWHHLLLAELGLQGLSWPQISPLDQHVGHFRIKGTTLSCYPATGDQQCALLGAMLQEDELSVNIATGSQVSLLGTHLEFGCYETRPFFDGKWLKTITHLPAGRSLDALIRLLTELSAAHSLPLIDTWPYIEKSAAAVPSSEMKVNLAFFATSCGTGGELTNISEENLTVGHLFRASFESMAENYFTSAARLSAERRWKAVVFSGGMARKSSVLRGAILKRFQVEHRVAPTEEDTLLGLMAISMKVAAQTTTMSDSISRMSMMAGNGHTWL